MRLAAAVLIISATLAAPAHAGVFRKANADLKQAKADYKALLHDYWDVRNAQKGAMKQEGATGLKIVRATRHLIGWATATAGIITSQKTGNPYPAYFGGFIQAMNAATMGPYSETRDAETRARTATIQNVLQNAPTTVTRAQVTRMIDSGFINRIAMPPVGSLKGE